MSIAALPQFHGAPKSRHQESVTNGPWSNPDVTGSLFSIWQRALFVISNRLAFVALATVLYGTTATAQPKDSSIEFTNCEVTMPGTPLKANARCGSLMVAENPDDPDGRQIELNIAVAPARARSAQPDPVFIFAGGPGQAATEVWPIMQRALRGVQRERDIVMIDQRGTGQSNPLDCAPPEDESLETELDLELVRDWAADCLESLDGDPRFYTSTIAMMDYDRVREAMGYEQINLLGGSYGTRTAQVYLRMFPERVRTVLLDGVVPMELNLGQEHAMSLDRSIARVFEDCRNDARCHALYPGLDQRLAELITHLRENPRELTITNPVTGAPQKLTLTADTLAVAFRMLSYDSQSQGMLPLLLHEASSDSSGNGDPLERVAAQSMMVMSGMLEQLSRGMELSVICSEDFPGMTRDPDAATTLLGDIMFEALEAQCSVWPRGEVPDGFHQPVVSDVPVLLMSGERDPVTPPHYAEQTATHFSNSLQLQAKGQAHIVVRNPCIREIAQAFFEAGSVEGLDTSCVEKIESAPFFTSLLGPDP